MTLTELREEIEIEVDAMTEIVTELVYLYNDVAEGTPTLREKTAAGAFLAQFYNGIENILKRICVFHSIPLPTGINWHTELFRSFCDPSQSSLPILFDKNIAERLAPFRKFRHVFFHSYGIHMDWERMRIGIEQVETIFLDFKRIVLSYLQSLEREPG